MENQESNEDRSQEDSHPEVGPSVRQSRHSIDSDTDEAPHMLTGGPEEIRNRPHMVTGGPEETRYRPHMVTRRPEEIRYRTHMVTEGPKGIRFRPHMVTGRPEVIRYRPHMETENQEDLPYCSLGLLQENKRRRAPQFSHHLAVRTPLRQLNQTRFCWPFSSWRAIAAPATSTTTLTKFQNWLNPSRQQCPPSPGNQRNLNCLKICSKQV